MKRKGPGIKQCPGILVGRARGRTQPGPQLSAAEVLSLQEESLGERRGAISFTGTWPGPVQRAANEKNTKPAEKRHPHQKTVTERFVTLVSICLLEFFRQTKAEEATL